MTATMTAPSEAATDRRVRKPSAALRRVLVEAFTVDELRHILSALEARDHVPDSLAFELGEELGNIYSAPPIEEKGAWHRKGLGWIYNRETIGWWRRRAERLAEAKAAT